MKFLFKKKKIYFVDSSNRPKTSKRSSNCIFKFINFQMLSYHYVEHMRKVLRKIFEHWNECLRQISRQFASIAKLCIIILTRRQLLFVGCFGRTRKIFFRTFGLCRVKNQSFRCFSEKSSVGFKMFDLKKINPQRYKLICGRDSLLVLHKSRALSLTERLKVHIFPRFLFASSVAHFKIYLKSHFDFAFV